MGGVNVKNARTHVLVKPFIDPRGKIKIISRTPVLALGKIRPSSTAGVLVNNFSLKKDWRGVTVATVNDF